MLDSPLGAMDRVQIMPVLSCGTRSAHHDGRPPSPALLLYASLPKPPAAVAAPPDVAASVEVRVSLAMLPVSVWLSLDLVERVQAWAALVQRQPPAAASMPAAATLSSSTDARSAVSTAIDDIMRDLRELRR